MSDETDTEEGGEGFYAQALPSWRFSLWDVAGIGLAFIGGIGGVIHQGCNLLSRECAAAANYSRQNYDLRQAQKAHEASQRAIGDDLRALIEGSGTDEA